MPARKSSPEALHGPRKFNLPNSPADGYSGSTAEWPRFGKAKLLSGIPHTAARRDCLWLRRAFSSQGGGRCFDNWHLISFNYIYKYIFYIFNYIICVLHWFWRIPSIVPSRGYPDQIISDQSKTWKNDEKGARVFEQPCLARALVGRKLNWHSRIFQVQNWKKPKSCQMIEWE